MSDKYILEESEYTCYFAKKTVISGLNSTDLERIEQKALENHILGENVSQNLVSQAGKKISPKSSKENSQVLGLTLENRRRHLYILGKTGMGKSTMIQNIILQDIFAGIGTCLIDPHGDSSEYILDRIPKHRHQDVIYLNPADTDFPVGLNVLESENGEPDFLIAAGLMSVFKRIWSGSWSSRMEYILNNTLLALLEINSQIKKYHLEIDGENVENSKENSQLNSKSNSKVKFSKLNPLESEERTEERQKLANLNLPKIPNKTAKILHSKQEVNLELAKKLQKLGTQTLLGVVKMLSDNDFCELAVGCIQNPMVYNFWTREYANFSEKYRQEAVAPILNKIGQFFASSVIRNILGQKVSSFNFRTVMDTNKILLVNLSKGRLGDDNSNLLGSLIVNKLQLAAMTRVNLAESERMDFCLAVDEFQNFTTESFVSILSEARKYRLNLILAHQYIGQLEESGNINIKRAIFGNVGSLVSFAVGAVDARELVLEFGKGITAEDLVNLRRNYIVAKLSANSENKPSFVATTLPSIFEKFGGQKELLIELSRQSWTNTGNVVETKIEQFLKTNFGQTENNLKLTNPKENKTQPRKYRAR